MLDKIYFCLLILCGFLCQGIVGVTSGSVVRRKRVINSQPGGETLLKRGDAKFVVNIKELPGNLNICVGAILSKYTVITAAAGVARHDAEYLKILAGSVYSFRGSYHDVIKKETKLANHPQDTRNGIALLIVEPAFIFNHYTAPIELHSGALLPGMSASIFGWGCDLSALNIKYRFTLRSINVTLMGHQECVNIYRNRAHISEKEICTYDPHQHCGHTDLGAPLVINGYLAGLYIWKLVNPDIINPDVFAVVQHLEYSQWIRNKTVHSV